MLARPGRPANCGYAGCRYRCQLSAVPAAGALLAGRAVSPGRVRAEFRALYYPPVVAGLLALGAERWPAPAPSTAPGRSFVAAAGARRLALVRSRGARGQVNGWLIGFYVAGYSSTQ